MNHVQIGDVSMRPLFARHETFAPRFGWLRKGYIAVTQQGDVTDLGSDVFLLKESPVLLGVGKNMVNAIRYWMQAFKLAVEQKRGGTSRAWLSSATPEAHWLLADDGADPFLEDPASLWLLHWWLLRPPCHAPSWWIAFHAFPHARFTEDQLIRTVEQYVAMAGWEIAPGSIAKDVDCLTKMYAPRKTSTGSPGSFEDLLDCPFRELALLEASPDIARTWRFTEGPRPTLPPAVIAYACLDYASRFTTAEGSITLGRLASEPGSPGLAFRLTEPVLAARLEEALHGRTDARIDEGAGQRRLSFDKSPHHIKNVVLSKYFGVASAALNKAPVRVNEEVAV